MNAQTQKTSFTGPAGAIDLALDTPVGSSRGVAVIAHPHPLFGGTLDNKVVQTLARAFTQAGWTAVRFNFRGVGGSEGVYDEGRGVPKSDQLAATWYSKAADQGDADAQYTLGQMYADGRGLPKDAKQAATWYRKAAEQGHADAQIKARLKK